MRTANVDISANGKWSNATGNALLHVVTQALLPTVNGNTVSHTLPA